MATSSVKPIPDGMHRVTPMLVCDGAAAAIDWYKRAFGAEEESRLPGPDGKLMHGQIRIFGDAVMLCDCFPDYGSFGPDKARMSPVVLHIYTEDADALFARALEAGATVRMPLENTFWGDRYGQLTDPFGHAWSIATHLQDLSPEEIKANFAKMCG
jgi:uncharacterized glyoxalase superfamily protein PhnB